METTYYDIIDAGLIRIGMKVAVDIYNEYLHGNINDYCNITEEDLTAIPSFYTDETDMNSLEYKSQLMSIGLIQRAMTNYCQCPWFRVLVNNTDYLIYLSFHYSSDTEPKHYACMCTIWNKDVYFGSNGDMREPEESRFVFLDCEPYKSLVEQYKASTIVSEE